MIFPEELDNRSFRLLVERILKLQTDGKPLSNIEQELADLLAQFPELGFYAEKDGINIYSQFAESELNPFLIMSAIWQVTKQMQTDNPKGIVKIIRDYFHTSQLKSDDLYQVADIYLSLYLKAQQDEPNISEKDYLWEVYYALNQKEEPDEQLKNQQNPDEQSVPPSMIGQAFRAIARELHDDVSHIKLTPKASTKEIFAQLPIEWINAMSNYWGRPDKKLKRDRIDEITKFFTSSEFVAHLQQTLSREEKKCLSVVRENKNSIPYSRASREFGPEHNDGYWWTQDAPKSTLGNLRMKGLLAVGEINKNDEITRVVMIPHDIKGVISKVI